ncbi:unnamed protein product [Closterium sp. Yama58-4]|nr:unnamed protein product [Closterium sp. Yama58-4]
MPLALCRMAPLLPIVWQEGSVASDESFSLSEGGTDDDDMGEGDSAQPLPHHLSLSAAAVPPGGELNVFLDAASLPHVLPSASYYGTHGNHANHTILDAHGNYGIVPRHNEPMGHGALGVWVQHYTALQEGAAGLAGGTAPPAAAAGALAGRSHSSQHTAGRPRPPLHLHRVPSAPDGVTSAASGAASRAGLPPWPTGHSASPAHLQRRGGDLLPAAAPHAFPPMAVANAGAGPAAAASSAAATAAAGASRAQGGREWGAGRRAGAGAGVVLGRSKSMGGTREREAGARDVGEREAGRVRARPWRAGAARRFSDTGAASTRGWAVLQVETTLEGGGGGQGGALVLQERESLQPGGIAVQQERHMAQLQQRQQQQQP